MIERSEDFGFTLKTGEPLAIVGDLSGQDFERDLALQLRITRAIHFAHPARAEGSDDFVRAKPRTGGQGHRRLDYGSGAVTTGHVARVSRSMPLSQVATWFQLTKFRLAMLDRVTRHEVTRPEYLRRYRRMRPTTIGSRGPEF